MPSLDSLTFSLDTIINFNTPRLKIAIQMLRSKSEWRTKLRGSGSSPLPS